PRGFMMKPDPARTLRELAVAGFPVAAKELTAGGALPLADSAAWVRARGVGSLAVDLAGLDPEFRGLAGLRAGACRDRGPHGASNHDEAPDAGRHRGAHGARAAARVRRPRGTARDGAARDRGRDARAPARRRAAGLGRRAAGRTPARVPVVGGTRRRVER